MQDRKSQPRVGDISLCIYCGTALRFTKGLLVQRLTDAEFMALPAYARDELRRHQIALAYVAAQRGPLRPKDT